MTGGNWVELPAGAWQHTKRRVSSCQARAHAAAVAPRLHVPASCRTVLTVSCFCAPSHRHSPLTPCCQVEVDIMFNRLLSHPPEGRHSGMAKFRILSVDIPSRRAKRMRTPPWRRPSRRCAARRRRRPWRCARCQRRGRKTRVVRKKVTPRRRMVHVAAAAAGAQGSGGGVARCVALAPQTHTGQYWEGTTREQPEITNKRTNETPRV